MTKTYYGNITDFKHKLKEVLKQGSKVDPYLVWNIEIYVAN